MLLLLIVAGIVFLWLIKAPIMSWYMTEKMKVPVSVSNISMWPSETVIHDFKIRNTREFSHRNALEIDKTTVNYQFSKLTGTPSVIDQIVCDGITLVVECSDAMCKGNNWTAIGAGMDKPEKHPHEVLIHKLILTNIRAEIYGFGLKGTPIVKQVDRLEFNEIDSAEGFPTKELIKAIFGGMGIDQYIKDLLNPQNVLKKALPSIFGQAMRESCAESRGKNRDRGEV